MKNAQIKPVKILHVVGLAMARGGAETWLMHILRNIDREKFKMDFMVELKKPYDYDEEIQSLGSKLIHGPRKRRPLEYGPEFKRILRENGPYDVVHSHVHHYSGYVLRLARQAGVPVRIAHSHNDFSPQDASRGRSWKVYVALMRRWIYANATLGLAASREAAAALFGENWEKDPRWNILHCGIDLSPFEKPVDQKVRKDLGIPETSFVLGHVGRFFDQKNHKYLVRIAAEAVKRDHNARLLMVGSGPLRPAIEEKVRELGIEDRVVFAGSRSDIPEIMLGAMDVFVLPSLFEGLPLVGIEAQAAGLPILLSDAVSRETDVAKPLIHRLSISEPPALWAEVALGARKGLIPQKEALRLVRESYLNVTSSVEKIKDIYANGS